MGLGGAVGEEGGEVGGGWHSVSRLDAEQGVPTTWL